MLGMAYHPSGEPSIFKWGSQERSAPQFSMKDDGEDFAQPKQMNEADAGDPGDEDSENEEDNEDI